MDPAFSFNAHQNLDKTVQNLDQTARTTPTKKLLNGRLEIAVNDQRDKAIHKSIQEIVLDPAVREKWQEYAKKEVSTPHQEKIQKLAKAILYEAEINKKIIQACNKYDVDFLEYNEFMRDYDDAPDKNTPLTRAVDLNRPDMVKVLIELGHDINEMDSGARTPLIKAIEGNEPGMVKLLVRLRANLNHADKDGWRPLTYAIALNKPEMVELLVRLRAKLHYIDKEGLTPLTFAVAEKKPELVKLLEKVIIQVCNKHNVEFSEYNIFMRTHVKTPGKFTPLTHAVNLNRPDMVKVLVELGEDINEMDSGAATPLYRAIVENQSEMVELLAELGADVNHIDAMYKRSPVMFAVERNNPKMVKLLKELDADIDLVDHRGQNPLAFAQENSKPLMAKLLIRLGADKDYADEYARRVFLAHVFGIKGKSSLRDRKGVIQSLDLEGYSSEHMMLQLSKFIDDFFLSSASKNIPLLAPDKAIIQAAIADAYPISNESAAGIVAKIKSGKPFVFLSGFEGHAVSIVICKNQLAICNRGAGRKGNAVEIFTLPADDVTEEMVQGFMKKHSGAKAFNAMIADLDLPCVDGYKQQPQKAGNCSWASAKGAFGILCRAYTNNERGRDIYKAFTAYAREKALIEYLKESPDPDGVLLKQIKEKLEDKQLKQKLADKPGLTQSIELLKNTSHTHVSTALHQLDRNAAAPAVAPKK